jgi:hypothetical protein
MAINVFEGARRLMAVALVLILIVGMAAVYNSSPYLSRYYLVNFAGSPTAVDSCPAGSDLEYTSAQVDGNSVSIELCFPGFVTEEGRSVIGYVDSAGQVLGNDRYSPAVDAYVENKKDGFTIPPAHVGHLRELLSAARQKERLLIIGVTLAAMFAFWLACVIFGWIVRGFLGIPSGADRKPSSP